jgi:iron complex outermembrane receptor protein
MQKNIQLYRRIKPFPRVLAPALLGLALVAATLPLSAQVASSDVSGEVEEYVGFGGEDPTFVLPSQPLDGALGFSKSLVDTPRSVSVINSDLIDKVGIRDGDQLFRIVPGTYTVNRWGIAGATNVRGNNADVYLRGMKRIDPQGNIRNVITMWDSVEVFRGPPSPIFGNGRIGGYVNYVPKSVRGTTGKYLSAPEGSVTAIFGSFERSEFQINYSAPLTIRDKPAGYQVFIQGNDSDSFYQQNFQRDRVVQASFSMNLTDRWRFETGGIYQKAVNAGQAGSNRVTQATLDNGTYIRGSALVNLDTDGNGRVSEAEIQASRNYSNGDFYTGPRPLTSLYFPIPSTPFTGIAGVPQSMKDLLALPEYAAAATSPAGQAILNSPSGGPIPTSGQQVPIGFFLNPAEAGYGERDWSLVAIEEKAQGHTYTAYADLFDDADPDKTQKLQFLFDYQYQDKRSQLPFNQIQEVTALETKYTAIRDGREIPFIAKLPEWVDVKGLMSANIRYTDGGRINTTGDYDSRRDLITGYTPTDTFASFLISGDRSFETGEPISTARHSEYIEYGMGTMADITFLKLFNIVGGARYDYIDADTTEGEAYRRTSSAGATFTTAPERSATGTDDAISWSISSSIRTGIAGFTPYYTISESSAVLSQSDQSLTYGNVNSGNILAAATLKEVGFKGSTLGDKLYYAVSAYEQIRSSSIEEEGVSFIRSTKNKGIEVEARWVPNKNISVILTGTFQSIHWHKAGIQNALVTASYLGFQDVLDPATGTVLFPADAFLFGGNPQVRVNTNDPKYSKFGQYPDTVVGAFFGYNFDNGFGFSWNSTYVSDVSASSVVPDLLILPSSFSHAAALYWNSENWRVALNIRNVTDELMWTPNSGSFGGTLLQTGLPRNYELALTRRF